AVAIVPDFLRLVFAVHIHGARIPVVLLTAHVIAALEDENLLASLREFVGECSATCAGADDDYVVMIVEIHWIAPFRLLENTPITQRSRYAVLLPVVLSSALRSCIATC